MHFLAILDYRRPCDLASEVDGENGETMSATLGCILLPGFRPEPTVRGIFGDPKSAVKKTVCGCCGRSQKGWYDHKICRVRDLSCGDTRTVATAAG